MYDTQLRYNSSPETDAMLAKCRRSLVFKPIDRSMLPHIAQILSTTHSRSCDYSIGGIYMWIRRFGYEASILDNTLFIKGRSLSDPSQTAFMLPTGSMRTDRAIDLVREYCRRTGLQPTFAGVPEERVAEVLEHCTAADVVPMDTANDYIYDADAMASFSGKKYNKKRNHVNRFIADNPGMVFEELTAEILPETILYFAGFSRHAAALADDTSDAAYERAATMDVLCHYGDYPFYGAVLRGNTGEIVSFTIGEVIGDTLFVHIEKTRHDIEGAGETICQLFARYMKERCPALRYINREDDAGDPGLRQSKLSYHPCRILRKYNIRL